VIETTPIKDKVDTPAKPDVTAGHANNEALALLGQQSNGVAKSAEPTSGVLDFGKGGDLFKSGVNSGALDKTPGSTNSDVSAVAKSDAPGRIDASAVPGTAAGKSMDNFGANYALPHMTVPKDESVTDFAQAVLGKNAAPENVSQFANEIAQFNNLVQGAKLYAGQDIVTPVLKENVSQPGDARSPEPALPANGQPGYAHSPQPVRPADHQPGDAHSPQPARPADHLPASPARPNDAQGESYTVKPGDNLWKIEKQHLGPHASNADILRGVQELAKANHIQLHTDSHGHVSAMIRPGQKLHLPPAHGHGDQPAQPHTPHRPGGHPVPHTPDVPPPNPEKPPTKPDVPPAKPDQPPSAPEKPGPSPEKPGPSPEKPQPGTPEKPNPTPDKPQGPGDKPIDPKDKPANPDDTKFDSPDRQKLIKDAEEKYKNDPDKLKEFEGNMKALEDRAGKDGLSPQEVQKTYQQVDRLLEAKGEQPTSTEQRQHLAEQVMKQAGHPYDISQGQHGTCAINNGVEVRTYTKNPSEAAKLVTDVATTGEYRTKDGHTIKIDPTPHGESTWYPTPDGSRTHASEIFQLTAANIRLDEQNRQGWFFHSKLHYEHYDAPPGSGRHDEAIMDHSTDPPTYVGDDPGFTTANDGKLRDIYQSITGVHDTGTVIGRDTYLQDTSDSVKRFHTEQEMNDYLAQAKKDGKFPIAVAIDTTSEPFWTDSGNGTAGGSGGGHIVSITDYHPGNPPTVEVENSWGSRSEHLGNNAISAHDLFNAMDAPANKAQDMQNDANAARAAGRPDHYSELEAARLDHATKSQNDQQYEQRVQQEMQRMQQDWAAHPDAADRAKSMQKLDNMIRSFSPEAQARLQAEEHRLGLE
jgi:LysM repeat protein